MDAVRPTLTGNKRSYQIDPANSNEACARSHWTSPKAPAS